MSRRVTRGLAQAGESALRAWSPRGAQFRCVLASPQPTRIGRLPSTQPCALRRQRVRSAHQTAGRRGCTPPSPPWPARRAACCGSARTRSSRPGAARNTGSGHKRRHKRRLHPAPPDDERREVRPGRCRHAHLHEGVLDHQRTEGTKRAAQHLVRDAAVQVAHEQVGVLLCPSDADGAAPELAFLHRPLAHARVTASCNETWSTWSARAAPLRQTYQPP